MSTCFGFENLHVRLRSIQHHVLDDQLAHTRVAKWTREHRDQVTIVVRETLQLLEAQMPERRATNVRRLEGILQQHLQHHSIVFEFRYGSGQCSAEQGMVVYENACQALLSFLWSLKEEYPEASVAPANGSPDAEKEYIARRLGRTKAGLETFVSKWRHEFRVDLPWVVRKPLLVWLPDLAAFEKWRTTSEGEKGLVTRRPGRPRKAALPQLCHRQVS